MSENMFTKLVQFTIKQSCVKDEQITRETKLYDDLGIYGDDAVDFLVAYGKTFNVDVSKFMAADYFKGEGIEIIGPIIKRIIGQKKTEPVKKTLTVAHLEKGIIAGRLDEEVING